MRSNDFSVLKNDITASSKKILVNKKLLTSMSSAQQEEYYKKLLGYSPKTGEGIDSRKALLIYMKEMGMSGESSLLTAGEKVASTSCVLEIHIRQPGFRRKLKSDDFLIRNGNDGGVDPSILHVAQDIIERSEVKDLKTHRSNLLNYIKGMAVPGGMLTLGNGQHLIPLKYIDQIHDRIAKFKEERFNKINDFEERYPSIIETAKNKRGIFFKEYDYPDFSVIRQKYSEEYRFISNNVPEELEKAFKEIYELEKEKIRLECAAAAQDIRNAQRSAWLGIIEHYTESLGNDEETGKPKKFYESGTSNLIKFMDDFKNKDLTDDTQLGSLIDQARELLQNKDIKQIRTDQELRTELSKSFTKIKEESDKLIVVKTRKFDLM